jgi:hypothetical protein
LGGLEPPTSCSTDRRSNQLSYNCILREAPRKRGSRMGRKLGATPGFGKPRSTRNIVVSGPYKVHLHWETGWPWALMGPLVNKEARAEGPGFFEC